MTRYLVYCRPFSKMADQNNNSYPKEGEGSGKRELKKSVFDLTVAKAFLAGVLVAHLSKNLVLGFIIGSASGVYCQQNYSNIPDVTRTWQDFLKRFRSSKSSNK